MPTTMPGTPDRTLHSSTTCWRSFESHSCRTGVDVETIAEVQEAMSMNTNKDKNRIVHFSWKYGFIFKFLSFGLTAKVQVCFGINKKPLSRGRGANFSPCLYLSAFLNYFYFNSRRNFSATVRRDLIRAKYLSLASTSVQGESGVLVFNSISSAAVM